jgi:NADPH:quinone reductase-like Zn-dependent oxidoreductase
VLGIEFSGEIVELGERVSRFQVGDAVIGFSAGLGAHAEYKVMKEDAAIVLKPKQMSFEEAAALPFGGTTALHFLRDVGHLKEGEKVLVIGAGGSVGSAAVQLAKHLGARVTAVCSASKSANVLALGAERVIDYRLEDFTKGSEKYDVILDTIGSTTFSQCCDVLSAKGRLLMIAAGINDFMSMAWTGIKGGKRALGGVAPERASHLLRLIELFELGAYRPMIDSVFPMDQIVDAHRRVDSGHKFGSVVVRII